MAMLRAASTLLAAVLGSHAGSTLAAEDRSTNLHTATAPATCGPGSRPETGLQGQVPMADRLSGRSQQGYSCNLEQVGQFQGEGTGTISVSSQHCAYLSTAYSGRKRKQLPGVQVVDVSDPAQPRFVKSLATKAFEYGTWESLKISPDGSKLAGAGVGWNIGAGMFDLYDISDCANPKLLNKAASGDSQSVLNIAHEGEWSPDGRTYWASGLAAGSLSAIDVSNPAKPKNIYFGGANVLIGHGMSFNADGTRMYLATLFPAGLVILDVSEVQNRKALSRRVKEVSRITWKDGSATQRAEPVTIQGKPFLIAIDEIGGQDFGGGIRFIDISNERNPVVVSHLRLEVQLPQHRETALADSADNGIFQYDAHYCSVDRPVEPTALACGYMQSGIRVFDIRNPAKPREIAYFNPPAQTGRNAQLPGSEHASSPVLSGILEDQRADLSADWCSSAPRFVGDQLWAVCNDNGFLALKFTNGAYPIR